MSRDWHSSALVFIGATVSLGLLFGAWYCDVTAIRPISQSLEEGLHAHLSPPETHAASWSLESIRASSSLLDTSWRNYSSDTNSRPDRTRDR